jgi:hypothetical protein
MDSLSRNSKTRHFGGYGSCFEFQGLQARALSSGHMQDMYPSGSFVSFVSFVLSICPVCPNQPKRDRQDTTLGSVS